MSAPLVSVLPFWERGDTPFSRGVWAAAAVLFVAASAYGSPRPARGTFGMAAAGGLLAMVLGLAGQDQLALGIQGDESTTALTAQRVLRDGAADLFRSRAFDIPTFGYLWFTPLVGLLPSPIAAVRATAALAGAVMVAMVTLWGRTLAGPRAGLIAGVLLATCHTRLYFSHLGTSNALALAFATSVVALLTVALVRNSALAAALAALALVGVFFTWAGAREVLPIVALSPVVAWRGIRRLRTLGPLVLATGGAALLLAGPALTLRSQSLDAFLFPRGQSVILWAGGALTHTSQVAGTTEPLEIAQFQPSRTMSAFLPQTFGDRSTFYQFARPIVDPATLGLALIGLVAAMLASRRQPAWLLPLALASTAFLVTAASLDPPNYPRLSLLLPVLVLLAALPLAKLSRRGRFRRLLAVSVVTAISLLNLWWFFVEYPREGMGDFERALLVQLAQQAPVYVVTPNYNIRHETIVLLDPQQRVQLPPLHPDSAAIWVAVGPNAQAELAAVRPIVPASYEPRRFTDNAGRVILYALVPP